MASNGSESPTKSKRSRAEMEAEDRIAAPTAQTNDGVVTNVQCDTRNIANQILQTTHLPTMTTLDPRYLHLRPKRRSESYHTRSST